MNLRQLLILAAAFSVANASGASPPPGIPSFGRLAAKSPPVTAVKIGALDVILEETTLRDIIGEVGYASTEHSGDAGESEYWICYATDNSLIWIVSDGEMGGSDHTVTRISAVRRTKEASVAGCSPPDAAKVRLLVNGKIALSAQTSQELLPGEAIGKSGSFVFDCQGKSGEADAGRCSPDGFDVNNWFTIVSDRGKVSEIHLGQISSC